MGISLRVHVHVLKQYFRVPQSSLRKNRRKERMTVVMSGPVTRVIMTKNLHHFLKRDETVPVALIMQVEL